MCASMLDHLYVEFGMRHQDEEVPCFGFGRERGHERTEPHINGHYDLSTAITDKPQLVKREHATIKSVLEGATDMPFRLMLRIVNPNNRTYGYGYDQKDKGKAHYLHVSMGFTELELQQALNVYRAKAAQNAYSGSEKMHKNPASNKTQVDIKVGNAHVLAAWFVAHHGLQALSRWLTLSTVIGFAIQTGNYRLGRRHGVQHRRAARRLEGA